MSICMMGWGIRKQTLTPLLSQPSHAHLSLLVLLRETGLLLESCSLSLAHVQESLHGLMGSPQDSKDGHKVSPVHGERAWDWLVCERPLHQGWGDAGEELSKTTHAVYPLGQQSEIFPVAKREAQRVKEHWVPCLPLMQEGHRVPLHLQHVPGAVHGEAPLSTPARRGWLFNTLCIYLYTDNALVLPL